MKRIFLILLTLLCPFIYGQSIFSNEITGSNPGQISPYITGQITDLNITVTGISRGSGIQGRNANNRYNAINWDTPTLDSNDYFEFTISPNAGYEINFISFEYTGQSSPSGPVNVAFRSSLDSYLTDIGSPNITGTLIDLSTSSYQNISSSITFRFYGWGATGTTGTFSINDFAFNGSVTPLPCPAPAVTWDGSNWSPSAPNSTIPAIINGDYSTGINGNFTACNLTVNLGNTLTINDNTFVEIENDVTVDGGTISVNTNGAFVQNGTSAAAGSFSIINSGNAFVNKTTKPYYDSGLHYVYWSSPVTNADITTVFTTPDDNRRFSFNASLFLDQHTVGTTNGIPDDIDDDGNDWEVASGSMLIGHGYAVTASAPPPVPMPFPYSDAVQFSGAFNTGDISVPVYRNDNETNDSNWNFLGNPYPSAISTDDFFALNGYDATLNPSGAIENILYFWTHNSVVSNTNPGNDPYNFSQDDFAYINLSGGVAAVSGGDIPNKFVPSGQGFFVAMSNNAITTGGSSPVFSSSVMFTNDMRRADGTSNSQFFKNSNSKKKLNTEEDKLWINLTSDNGVFSQILVAYTEGATDNDDGLSYDARRIASRNAGVLYSTIKNSNTSFAIQGKSPDALDKNETIKLGFKTNIDVSTLYKLSIGQLQGEFLSNNTIFLKDKLLKKVHDLSNSDYTFTSEAGEFNKRFEIVFNKKNSFHYGLNKELVTILSLRNGKVLFKTSEDLIINSVSIFDALIGKKLYEFKGDSNSEIYSIPNNSIYIAKIELSDGAIITKKIILK